ncbi:MAG: Holliday junction branch migration protein RuvA [Bacteroidales bacterium]|nr:Holliday junction branch migration protein RuvA [Bacteroidales bacterium]
MIEYIEGKMVEKKPAFIVIDCGGIAYFINVSLNTFSNIKDVEKVKLYIHQIIREDSHQLYGFYNQEERQFFRLLITVSGIGANTARMILSSLTVGEVQKAILSGNAAVLQSIKGIGAKSALRIIVDLKDKIGKQDIGTDLNVTDFSNLREEAVMALSMLGFNKSASEKAIDNILRNQKTHYTVEELIKQALKNI